jgi:NitT/TauT family transport system permease protein
LPASAFSVIAAAVAWETIARLWEIRFLPPLSEVFGRLGDLVTDGRILEPLAGSLQNLAIGFTLSLVFGIGIGLLMGVYRKVEMALDWWVYGLDTAPSLVFAPIFFAIFGLGREPVIAVIVMYSIFTIIVMTVAAVHSVPPSLIDMGRSYCASDLQLFRRVILPAATPLMMAGVRLSMGKAVKGMINGEMFIAAIGLGAVLMTAGRRFDASTVFAIMIVAVAVAIVANSLVKLVDRRLTSWLPVTYRKGSGGPSQPSVGR